jgi:signal transduction histidine kinase/DNA-binding LacI/PurR family transcriptional regulator/AraC-like DNA-binding protein
MYGNMGKDQGRELSSRAASKSQERPTLAFFSSSPGGAFNYENWQMWRGIAEAARENSVNLLYVAGGEFEFDPGAVLYQLIGPHNASGLVFWNDFISSRSTTGKTHEFIDRYYPLPVVSIGLEVEGLPSILFDNSQGVSELLSHLIDFHGYQQIAFMGGYDRTTRLRYRIYEEVLTERGLFNPQLVGELEELEARGIQPGIDFQAIVASNDQTATRVIDTLRMRGIRIPDQIAVTGFNDGQEARACIPPLTTMRLPFRKLGQQAVELLLGARAGKETPEQTCIPLDLVIRRSCGCLDPLAERAAIGRLIVSETSLEVMLASQRTHILEKMASGMEPAEAYLTAEWARQMLDSFISSLHSSAGDSSAPPSVFLQVLNEILGQAVLEGMNANQCHEALSVMRRYLLPHLDELTRTHAEDMVQQARVLIGQTAARAEVHRNWRSAQRVGILRQVEAALFTTVDINEVITILVNALARLNIRQCYLVLYEDPAQPTGWARLVLAYRNGRRERIESSGIRFPATQLLPQGWISSARRFSMVLESLHFREEQIGFIIFETEPPETDLEGIIYDILQTQLSIAMKGIHLRQELQSALLRAEEANQLKSRFLSMVSHELRTPLNLIVGLSEMALREQERSQAGTSEVLRKFQEQIYISGQHLDRLIRDVLDLASSQVGKMTLVRDTVDLLPLLREVILMGRHLADQKNLTFREEIPPYLPPIWGDKTRLRQVLLNLLSNAIKFTAHGEVGLSVVAGSEEILVSVSDTGLGIPQEEQGKIFDEFEQSERTAVRGYGGIGLGLAITRRLVEMHDGRIWVSSTGEEGNGSTFYFTLPVMQEENIPEKKSLPAKTHSDEVLILTKTLGGAQKLAFHLAQHGFLVGERALDTKEDLLGQLQENPPGAVVLDLLPVSDQGWNIMKTLKEHPATQDIPVLFFSLLADQDSGSVIEMEYLSKPVDTAELVRTLERHGLGKLNINHKKTPGGKKIMLIDDEPGILELHTRMVKSLLPDSQIMAARDGREGLAMMRREFPDLLLLDLMMPELDGFGVIKAMQEDENLSKIPVVVLSGQVLTERDMTRLNQGVATVLGKGLFSTQETMDRIGEVLSRSKHLGSEAQRLFRQAMAYIHENYMEPLQRSAIARHLSINEQYLTRCFDKEIGISPMAYLNRYRIQQAKKSLETGKRTITQVALETGFSSQSYFSRMFQKEVGVSPKAYQQGERGPKT